MMTHRLTLSTLALLAALATTAQAQPLPTTVSIGGENMTVGFELKTTDKGSGPNGRSSSHTLMKYIIPSPGAQWSQAERAQVEAWGSMSQAQRTEFFFKAYKGGYTANNFVVDTQRFPYMDKAVSWYGESLGIPHIEIRSAPFDNPRKAMETMQGLKAEVGETIAFHMHLRFPDTGVANRAEAMAEYLRRTSFAIWLRRADYSSKTDFVLKQADNQPMNTKEMETAARRLGDSSQMGEIIGRRGLRVQRMRGPNGESLIDVEFRGLMKDTGRLKNYLRATGNAFSEGGEVGPWTLDANNPFRNAENSLDEAFERNSKWNPTTLNKLTAEMKSAMERYGVSSPLSAENLETTIKALATADTEAGKRTLLPSSFNWLFMPLEYDPALPEGIQEEIVEKKRAYLKKLLNLAKRVQQGEFGELGTSSYKPIKTASRARKILHDFVNETYTDAERTAKLFEWYETSLFKPQETVERTERWRSETGRNREAEFRATRGDAEGFARRRLDSRRVTPYEHTNNWWRAGELQAEFEDVRRGMVARMEERIAETTDATQKADLERGLERVKRAKLEIVKSADLFAETTGSTVRASQGAVNEILDQVRYAPGGDGNRELGNGQRSRVARQALGLIFGHELAHVAGTKAETVADAEGVKAVEKVRGAISDVAIRGTVETFDRPSGVRHWDNLINRLKSFTRYGTPGMRRRAMERAARGEADPYAKFRRPDGTLNWKTLTANRAAAEALGLGQFGLALFLKELAVVAKSGDRVRIEEFFEGLMTTDFYKQYGLFVIGARAGDVAYSKYLQRFVRPGFVNSIFKTNLILAAGLALPQIAEGTFTGKAFVISLTSLGLSSTAVQAGVRGISWVTNLKTASPATIRSLGLRRVAAVGGWFYKAAELAVILYFADEIDSMINGYLDHKAATNALADASEAFYAASGDADATIEEQEQAADGFNKAWIDYRNYLYTPLHEDEAIFASRMEKAARKAKIADDVHKATLARIGKYPALLSNILSRFDSLESYAESLYSGDDASLNADVAKYAESYNNARDAHLEEIYRRNRREGGLLDDVGNLDWLASGADASAADAPYAGREDVFARFGRDSVRRDLRSAIKDVSRNRIQAYDDQVATLDAAIAARRAADLDTSVYDQLRARILKTKGMDDHLINGKSDGMIGTMTPAQSGGATEAVDELGD